jgi:hypothetical protein
MGTLYWSVMQRKPRMMILASAAERPKIPSGLDFAGDAMFVVEKVESCSVW